MGNLLREKVKFMLAAGMNPPVTFAHNLKHGSIMIVMHEPGSYTCQENKFYSCLLLLQQ